MKVFVKFSALAAFVALACTILAAPVAALNGFLEIKLVSDIPGLAKFTDPLLVNPWGMAIASNCNIWIADNGTGVSTIYKPDGTIVPLVVTIPGPGGMGQSAPTGLVAVPNRNFIMENATATATAPALFIWDTEDGTIAAWNPTLDPNAVIQVDNSASGAVYKGLAICPLRNGNARLFATNFASGLVEVYDREFNFLFSFTDPVCIPPEYAPFGIRCINGLLYVTYAVREAGGDDDVPGPGNGFVIVFNTNGQVVKRLIAHGVLNSPWGLAIAPQNFGIFGGALLVGNFGDGRINAFNPVTGAYIGTLKTPTGQYLVNEGLWALDFLPDSGRIVPPRLYFTAGINDENDGLFGYIFPEPLTFFNPGFRIYTTNGS